MSTEQSIIAFAVSKLAELREAGRFRTLEPTARSGKGQAWRDEAELVSFCDNDYLGLSNDLRLIQAAKGAAETWGVGAGASRLVTGDNPLNHQIEEKLAALKGTDGARLFGSGYLANIGTIPVLVGKRDRIIMDELSHACMRAGAQLSGAEAVMFKHNDVDDLRRHLACGTGSGRTLVLTETVFSMDGDLAPLTEIGALCEQYGAWMMTDDAHGLGVVKQDNPAPIKMGTLSKAAGSYGGYVCGPTQLMALLTNRARSLIFTTGLPPTVLAATLKALEIISEEPQRGERAMALARLFCDLAGLPKPESPIVPVILGEERTALRASEYLRQQGLLVTAIRPPTVAAGTSRLRVTFSATHREEDVRRLAKALIEVMVTA